MACFYEHSSLILHIFYIHICYMACLCEHYIQFHDIYDNEGLGIHGVLHDVLDVRGESLRGDHEEIHDAHDENHDVHRDVHLHNLAYK
jgi:uncharacterized protein YjaG (DUF416 family)